MFLLLLKEVSPKSKTLVSFESLCLNMDMPIFLNSWNSGADSEKFQLQLQLTFSTTAEVVERILKTVFNLVFSKIT